MLSFKEFTSVYGARFLELYFLYRSIFTDKNEAENFDGINAGLELNSNKQLQKQYGKFKECWVAAIEDGKVIGGINYTVFKIPSLDITTAHINYLFTLKEYRGKGIGTSLVNHIKETSNPKYIFCEQNDPEKMSPEEIQEHLKSSGISAEARNEWWAMRGFVKLNFTYIQPPLTEDDDFATGMFLSSCPATTDVKVVKEHLRRFFYISVLKGRTFNDPQIEQLIDCIKEE